MSDEPGGRGVRAIGGSGTKAVSYLITLRFVLLVPITVAGLAVLLAGAGWRARPEHARPPPATVPARV